MDGAFGTNLGSDVCAPSEFGAWVTQRGNQYSQLRDQCSKRRVTHILIRVGILLARDTTEVQARISASIKTLFSVKID